MKLSLRILFILTFYIFSVLGQGIVNDVLTNKVVIDGESFYLYKVKAAEGFYTISKKFGVSKKDIVDANPECAEGLKLDMLLKIPVVEGRNANQQQLDEADEFIYHIVEKGQSVFYIASKYNVSIETIYANNPGTSNVLLEGAEIRIPKEHIIQPESKPDRDNSKYLYHIVKPKESLFFLQQLYDVSIRDIVKDNPGLADGILKVGMELRIPKKHPVVKANEKLLSKPLEDSRYFYHKVNKGETLLAISRKYSVPLQFVKEANQLNGEQPLQNGVILNIPKDKVVEETKDQKSDKYILHRVTKKSTVGILSSKFGVEESSIKSLNPDVKNWNRVKKGTVVRIPIKKHFSTKEIKSEIPDNLIGRRSKLTDSALIRQALALGCDTIEKADTVRVSFFLPLFLSMNDTVNWVREETKDGIDSLYENDVKAIYPKTPIFRELLNGALIAINQLKKDGLNVEVSVFDTNRDTAKLTQILARPELKKQHLVIGPAFRNCIDPIAAFCQENGIKHILPFQATDGLIDYNNTMFQVNAPGKYHYNHVVDFISTKFNDYNIVVIKQRSYKDDRQELFSGLVKQRLLKDQLTMPNGEALRYKEIVFETHGQKGLEAVLRKDIPNLIIVPSEANGAINRVLPYLYGIKNKGDWDFSLLGFPEWQKLSGAEYGYLFNLHTYIYSPFYADYTSDETLNFLEDYRQWFGAEPTVFYPRPALLGHDLANFYITQYHNYGNDCEGCMNYNPVDLLQSEFHFNRCNNWGGFYNNDMYFFEYTPEFDINKLDY